MMRRRTEGTKLPTAEGLSVKQLFERQSFTFDVYQREYVWERHEVELLAQDLVDKFGPQWHVQRSVDAALTFDSYFLGSVITYEEDGRLYLADGQQRVTTLLLLLIRLYRFTFSRPDAEEQRADLQQLILAERRPARRFAVDVSDYDSCLSNLLDDGRHSTNGEVPTIQRIVAAYRYLDEILPADIRGEGLPAFVEWLMHRVSLVQINAGDGDHGLEMFERINARGRPLTPMDYLKSFLLSGAGLDYTRLDGQWRAMVSKLELDDGTGAADHFVATVLRSRCGEVVLTDGRPTTDGISYQWLREHRDEIRPKDQPAWLFTSVLRPLSASYLRLLRARRALTPPLQAIWFNDRNGITRQFDLTVAALQADDSEEEVVRKAAMVANFIDLFVISRGIFNQSYDQQEVDELVGEVLYEVRMTRTSGELGEVLGRAVRRHRLGDLSKMSTLVYNPKRNRRFVVYLLARLTSWLEEGAGRGDRLATLFQKLEGKRPHEVEHFFPTRPVAAETLSNAEYSKQRTRIGVVVLLGGPDNASLGGLPLPDKAEVYAAHYLLQASLHNVVYGRGMKQFTDFIEDEGLGDLFEPYDGGSTREFVDRRCRLYRAMAERIWDPRRLRLGVPEDEPPPLKRASRRRTTPADLMKNGFIAPNTDLVGRRRGHPTRRAVLDRDGNIRTESGQAFPAPSPAAEEALDVRSANGWTFWRVRSTDETLDIIRARYESSRQNG